MKIVVDECTDGKVVRVDVGHRLDLRAYKTFSEATVCAVENTQIVAIVVDFSDTYQLLESGRAVLHDLMMRTKYLQIPLRLVNANADINLKLMMLELATEGMHRNGDVAVTADQLRYA